METRVSPILSVVVPLFNEEEVVQELIQRVIRSCRALGHPFELLAVNDGSRDETLHRLVALSRDFPELRVIDLHRNFGHMAALSAGLTLALGKAVVTMDGDLQDPPELIPKLFAQWREGADIVYGQRTARHESFFQRQGTRFFYWLLEKVSETKIPKQVGTFGLMDRRVVDLLNRMPERDRFFAGLRAWTGGRHSLVQYERPDRAHGPSRVGVGGLFRLAGTALTSFSKVPLRYASLLSLIFGILLFLLGLSAIVIRLFTNLAIPGWATYTTLLGMMGFVQSLLLAILSEYVAVIFDEVKARPLYLVRQEFTRGRPREGDEANPAHERP